MRVEQQNKSVIDLIQQTGAAESISGVAEPEAAQVSKETGAVTVNMKDVTYGKPQKQEKTILEEMEKETCMSAEDRKNQMTVLSNTTSAEDYAKMQEEGFSLDATATNTIVTVTDKIKAELAKAGVDISVFGDGLSGEQLAEITGSPELAAQLAAAMKKADLPVTEKNLKEAAEALQQAETLQNPTEGTLKYLLDNELSPTIANLYLAQNSGSSSYTAGAAVDTDSYQEQIKQVILRTGLSVTDSTLEESRWLIANEVPLTPENLAKLHAIKGASIGEQPLQVDFLADAMAEAIAEGKRPADAVLVQEFQLKAQAEETYQIVNQAIDEDIAYLVDRGLTLNAANLKEAAAVRQTAETALTGQTAESISGEQTEEADSTGVAAEEQTAEKSDRELKLLTARRQLEEIRLVMTVEANYGLLKRGISIDTQPIEQLLAEYKELENSYYQNLLQESGALPTEENTALCKQTIERVEGIKSVPAYILGQKDIQTVNAAYESGKRQKVAFEKANERYETLMTAPRADMGDSLRKAFGNVDAILKDMSLETSEENRRAVRILAYNSLSITEESVMEMKAADEEVQRVFKNMTPAVVTRMIRDGIDPLNMDFRSLNTVAETLKSEEGLSDETEKFSEYLWKLEKNRQISAEERDSYIGIYRFIHQIESGDSAAVGALVHQGAELTMKNLLTAVRSEKKSGKMDYAVDDTSGERESSGYQNSITEQLQAAYQKNCIKDVTELLSPERMRNVLEKVKDWSELTPEQLKQALSETSAKEEEAAYWKEQLGQLEESAKSTADLYEILEKYDVPNTVNYVLALKSMGSSRNRMYEQLFDEPGGESETSKEQETLLEDFADAFLGEDDMEKAQQKLKELAEKKVAQTMEQENVTSLDVRRMRMLSTMVTLNHQMSKQEQYSVPLQIKQEIVNVSVKLKRDTGKTGMVDVMMESEQYGKVAASFTAKQEGVEGLLVFERQETKDSFEKQEAFLQETLTGGDEPEASLHYAVVKDLDFAHFSMGAFGEKAENTAENQENGEYHVQTGRLFHIAESFIRQLRSLE